MSSYSKTPSDPRLNVLPPSSTQQQQQSLHSRSASQQQQLKDNYKVIDKQFRDHLAQEEDAMKRLEQRREQEKRAMMEEFDRNTQRDREQLIERFEIERETINSELQNALQQMQHKPADCPVPSPPATISTLAGESPLDHFRTVTQRALLSEKRTTTPTLKDSKPHVTTAAATSTSQDSPLPLTELQSGIRDVRNEIMHKVGAYVYSNEAPIGMGGSARVYRCWSNINGKPYAIREITIDPNNERQTHESIMDEVALMKKLHHPNIITLHEVLRTDRPPNWYMILELCDSELIKLDKNSKPVKVFSEEDCRNYFQQLLLGVEYLHGQNILHRDIKPGNLLINKEKVLRITDFGLSRTLAGDDGMMARTTRGTRQFMAPEMFENLRSNGREKYEAWPTDIWSMGVTLFLMWNGDVPFPMPKNWNQPNFKVRAPFKDGTPRLLKELLDKMLEQDSAKRIKMEELRRDPWVIDNGSKRFAKTREENVGISVKVTDEDREQSHREIAIMEDVTAKFKELLQKRKMKAVPSKAKQTGEAVDQSPMEVHPAEGDLVYHTCIDKYVMPEDPWANA